MLFYFVYLRSPVLQPIDFCRFNVVLRNKIPFPTGYLFICLEIKYLSDGTILAFQVAWKVKV